MYITYYHFQTLIVILPSWLSLSMAAALQCVEGRTLCCCFTLSYNKQRVCEDHFGNCEPDETEMCCEGTDVCLTPPSLFPPQLKHPVIDGEKTS